MKKFAVIALVLFGTSCSRSAAPYYGSQTTANRSQTQGLWVHQIAQKLQGKADAFDVEPEDRQRHQRCVFFALEQLNLGEKCVWDGPETGDRGVIRVTAVYPMNQKVCHVFFTHLEMSGGNIKSWQDTACYNQFTEKWMFMSEY